MSTRTCPGVQAMQALRALGFDLKAMGDAIHDYTDPPPCRAVGEYQEVEDDFTAEIAEALSHE